MQGDPILRNASIDDIPSIEALLTAENLPTEGIINAIDTFWILDERGHLVGSIGLEIYEDVGFIRSVVVAPEKRGQGLGDRLMQVALNEALDRAFHRVYLFTVNADGFFSSFGFQKCPLEEFEPAVQTSSQYKTMVARPDLYSRVTPMLLEMRSSLRPTP